MSEKRRIMKVLYSLPAEQQSRQAAAIQANKMRIRELESANTELETECEKFEQSVHAGGVEISDDNDRLQELKRAILENKAKINQYNQENEKYQSEQNAARRDDLDLTQRALGGPGEGKMIN